MFFNKYEERNKPMYAIAQGDDKKEDEEAEDEEEYDDEDDDAYNIL
jgi:hypothetical protein